MDILDGMLSPSGNQEPDLNEFVLNQPLVTPVPLASVRNRASTSAFLSKDPEKAIENYRLMMKEAEEGNEYTQKAITQLANEQNNKLDLKGMMGILSDPTIPFETKQSAIKNFQANEILKDNTTTLLTNALTAESEGEPKEQEDARINTVDSIREIYQSWADVQGIQNAHGAALEGASAKTLFEMIEAWIVPFGNNKAAGQMAIAQAEKEGKTLSRWEKLKLYLMPGKATRTLADALSNVPPDQRAALAKSLVQTISENSGVFLSNNNQFVQFDKASTIFEQGGYSNTQEFLDNVSPLLDAIGIGQLFKGASKSTKAISKLPTDTPPLVGTLPKNIPVIDKRPKVTAVEKPTGIYQINSDGSIDMIKRIEINSVVRKENPVAPANVIQQANPAQARGLHEAVVSSAEDEVAEALYGVNRQQAITNDIYPQVATESGIVGSKVPNIDKNLKAKTAVPEEVVDMISNTGATYYTREEKAAARAQIVNNFKNAEGLSINDAMSSFKLEGGRVQIDAVYGLAEGSFLKAEDAVSQAKFALRNYGILDEEIEVLRKVGLDHVPVRLEDVKNLDGNYLVRVKTSHEIDPTDIGRLETFDVKRNLFDRVSPWFNKFITSPNRWMFDAASSLHPTYTGSAIVATDAVSKFEHSMIKLADEYAFKIKKFDKTRQSKIDDYIREANYNGVAFDHTDLTARGFSPEEISALRSWRDFWDTHYYLENYDIVRTLNANGFQMFKNQNIELYAKPIPKNQNLGKLYDPSTDSIVVHTKADGDALYSANGTYARLRRPVDINGDLVEYMIVRNTPTEYLRNFRGSDSVLNYRDGYFQIQYKAPKFVDEIVRDSQGNITSTRTVAVAGDTEEANTFASRMRSTSGLEYKIRGDVREFSRGGDEWWDVNSASGRIAQRHRGKLLEDASGLNHLGDGSYILNPVESAVRAAKSISGRTVTRPMLEAAKARAINQYGDFFPSDGKGGKRFPNSLDEIGAKGEFTSKQLADARTTWEYINYLENGYINNVDEAFKAVMNGLANMLGSKGLTSAERAAVSIGESQPTSLAKNSVFMAYVGSNVLRQWIIQTHQVVRTWSYNPAGWLTGRVPKYVSEYVGSEMNLMGSTDFHKFVKNSGMLDGVDKQNLVRGALRDAADSSNAVVKTLGTTSNFVRRIGFDVGESANLVGHLAAVYDRFKRAGRNLNDLHTRDEAYSEARALSYDMNFAGDFPYNQTSPSMVLQFMQVPHKAVLQMTNRRLDWKVRARMIAADMVMWGPPSLLIADLLGEDLLPDDDQKREAYLYGMESMLLNNMFNTLFEGDTKIDFSGLDPYDMQGWGKFFQAMYSGGMSEMFLNSPAGQLFVKDQGRTQNAIAAMQRYFAGFIDEDQPPETFISMMTEVAKIASGFNNAHKAAMLLEAKKRYDKYGSTIDQSVNHVEAWAQLLGFGTYDTKELYEVSRSVDTKNKKYKEDILSEYQTIKQYYATKLAEGNTDPRFITSVSGWILNKYKDEPEAMKILSNELERDLIAKEQALLYKMMKASGIPDVNGLKDDVKRSPFDEATKAMLLKRIEDVQGAKVPKENKE